MTPRGTSDGNPHHRLPVSLGAVLVALAVLMAGGPAGARGVSNVSHGRLLHAYDFDAPTSAAVVGAHLFVTNSANNSLTEIRTSNGSYVARISSRRFGFDAPSAVVAVGTDLFVANGGGNSVTEVGANRKLIRTISGPSYGFADPIALASSGGDLFVLNGAGSLTEVATGTGALVGTASGPTFGFDVPTGLAVANGEIFVANSAADTVTVLDAGDLTLVASLSGPTFAFSTPTGVAFDDTDVWVTNEGDESVTELSPLSLDELNVLVSWNLPTPGPIAYGNGYVFAVSPPGSSPMVTQITPSPATVNWMMCNTNGPYLFNNPEALVVAGSNLWVVNEGGNSLTEMDTVTGNLIRTVADP
ncbi:MAG TPA: hypothetical protein VN816_09095 [Acidimicrobiales bacterium]|nr:hypothetical protein [Acidimicrobiales bacterium]